MATHFMNAESAIASTNLEDSLPNIMNRDTLVKKGTLLEQLYS